MGDNEQEVEEREADATEAGDSAGREVKWAALPDGLKVLPAPEKLDESLLNKLVYIRWEVHGWWLGTITHKITNVTPRLFKHFNYRVKYTDGSTGPANLPLDTLCAGGRGQLLPTALQLVVLVGEG